MGLTGFDTMVVRFQFQQIALSHLKDPSTVKMLHQLMLRFNFLK
jgi:hypothetical protein